MSDIKNTNAKAKAEKARIALEQAQEQARLANEKVAIEKAEKERLAKEQAEKAKAEQDRLAVEKAEKAKAEQELLDRQKAEQAKAEEQRLAKEKTEKEAAEMEKADKNHDDRGHDDDGASDGQNHGKRNDDPDKHDGRGHGDDDHNDDGHADNGRERLDGQDGHNDVGHEHRDGRDSDRDHDHDADDRHDRHHDRIGQDGHHGEPSGQEPAQPVVGAPVTPQVAGPVEPPVIDEPDRQPNNNGGDIVGPTGNGPASSTPTAALSLKTVDAADKGDARQIAGTNAGEEIFGQTGTDAIKAQAGNDVIHAVNTGTIVLPLEIDVGMAGPVNPADVLVEIAGMPASATLSAGTLVNGVWQVHLSDLADLAVTLERGSDLDLKVTAHTTDGTTVSETSVLHVSALAAKGSIVEGGKGSDTIYASDLGDTIYGGSKPTGVVSDKPHIDTVDDNDVIFGGAGNDVIFGQSGDDQIFSGGGKNFISGGKGNDLIVAGYGYDEVHGNSGDDTIVTGTGSGVLSGEAGNDTFLIDGNGTYKIVGGSDFDTLDFSGAGRGVLVDISKGTAEGFGTLEFSGIEQVIGSAFADTIKGSSRADIINGGAGDDFIRGMAGADILTGGEGRDTFIYLAKDVTDGKKNLGVDTITDFSKEDVLDFTKLVSGQKWSSIDEVVSVKDDGVNSHVMAKVGGQWTEVVTLQGFTGHTANDMLKDGMILA